MKTDQCHDGLELGVEGPNHIRMCILYMSNIMNSPYICYVYSVSYDYMVWDLRFEVLLQPLLST